MLDILFPSLCYNIVVFMAENALTLQACALQSELEKALQDNASLFQKIG